MINLPLVLAIYHNHSMGVHHKAPFFEEQPRGKKNEMYRDVPKVSSVLSSYSYRVFALQTLVEKLPIVLKELVVAVTATY